MFDEEFASAIANARTDEEAFAIFSEDPDQALLLDDERNIVDSTLSELNSKLTAAGEYADEMSPSDVGQLIAAIDNARTTLQRVAPYIDAFVRAGKYLAQT